MPDKTEETESNAASLQNQQSGELEASPTTPDSSAEEDSEIEQLCSIWQMCVPFHTLTDENKAQLFRYLIRFDLAVVKIALADAVDFYLYRQKGSIETTLQKIA